MRTHPALLGTSLLLCWWMAAVGQADDAVERKIRERVAVAPHNPTNWRMLAKVLERKGDSRAATDALQQALALDGTVPAIHHDLGILLLAAGQAEPAVFHFSQVVELAPDSEHGVQAVQQLEQLARDPRYTTLVSFQAPWANAPRVLEEPTFVPLPQESQRLLLDVEFGGLYNSNVELAPISRQLATSELGGFQTYLAPELDFLLFDMDAWQVGAVLDTYFSFNERRLSGFDLQHYQPGAYFERTSAWGKTELVARAKYSYAFDLFGGHTFGNRHSLTTSLTILPDRPVTSLVYWTIDYTDFRDDGTTPTVDSVDGYTNTVGLSRSWEIDNPIVRRLDVGTDVQWAELRGADHRYQGVYVYGELRTASLFDSELVATGGWGYRDYPDFTGSPERNENFYVGGLRLDRPITDRWRGAIFFNYSSFDTQNTLFAAEQYTTGLYLTYQR